jgi:RNA polymerase sigma factor (sigma-70 family)
MLHQRREQSESASRKSIFDPGGGGGAAAAAGRWPGRIFLKKMEPAALVSAVIGRGTALGRTRLMANGHASTVLRHLRKLIGAAEEPTDGQLLERFAAGDGEAAFTALVRRHGPMVLGVCRRVLGDLHDAEDAFQATFLVLIRRAAALDRRRPLANWLYTVAYHTALRAKSEAARRRALERQARDMSSAEPDNAAVWRELRPVLDEELSRLPEKYREPFVLCYLEGKSNAEAARQLGRPAGTVKSRLARARDLLRQRLTRRGVALPAGLLILVLAEKGSAAVPTPLLDATTRAALRFAAGQAAPAAALAEGVLQTMCATKFKLTALFLLSAGLIGLIAGVCTLQALADKAAPQAKPKPFAKRAAAESNEKPRVADQKGLTFPGRVLDDAGKPLADAQVAVVAVRVARPWTSLRYEVLAQGKTDKKGRFHLAAAGASPDQFHEAHVLAGLKGHGLGWQRLPLAGKSRDAELRLPPARVIRGRLFDLQGLPAARVKGRVALVTGPGPSAPQVPMLAIPNGQVMPAPMMPGVRPSQQSGLDFARYTAPRGLSLWPQPVTTDAQGRFQLTGFGRGQVVELLIEDDRFATQKLALDAGKGDGPKEVRLSLAPPQKIEGRVTYRDTGKPAAGVWVAAGSFRTMRGFGGGGGGVGGLGGYSVQEVGAHTDARGRYRLNAYAGDTIELRYQVPSDRPYLSDALRLPWPKGAVVKTVNIPLERGALLRGKVVEKGSGKGVGQAHLAYRPLREDGRTWRIGPFPLYWQAPLRTEPDGSFQVVVPAIPGHLVCALSGKDFIRNVIGSTELETGKPGGQRYYVHAMVRLDPRVQKGPQEVTVAVRRGVTLSGQAVGPDGKPVRALLFAPGELVNPDTNLQFFNVIVPSQPSGGNIPTLMMLASGRFELHGCDPDRTYRVFLMNVPNDLRFAEGGMLRGRLATTNMRLPLGMVSMQLLRNLMVEGKDRLGAVVDISARKAGGKPLTVQLGPCSQAEVRFVNKQGKPMQPQTWLELVVAPAQGEGEATLAPEVAVLAAPTHYFAQNERPMGPDRQGRLKLPALIPGATYRVRVFKRIFGQVLADRTFTAEAGKTSKLPDIVIPEPKKD